MEQDHGRNIYTERTTLLTPSIFSLAISDNVKAREIVSPYLIVLLSSPSAQAPNSLDPIIVIGSDEQKPKELGNVLETNSVTSTCKFTRC